MKKKGWGLNGDGNEQDGNERIPRGSRQDTKNEEQRAKGERRKRKMTRSVWIRKWEE